MYRTPAKKVLMLSSDSSPEEPPRATVAQARRSFERQPESLTSKPAEQARRMPGPSTTFKDRKTEAAALLKQIKISLNSSRNLKTEIKNEIVESALRMCKLIMEAEEEKGHERKRQTHEEEEDKQKKEEKAKREEKEKEQLTGKISEHLKLLQETKEEMEKTREELSKHREQLKVTSPRTYASAVSGSPKTGSAEVTQTLHSIVVTSNDDQETGEEVVEKIRRAVKAKEEGIKIDKIRKAKDRKIIIGCQNKDELTRVKQNLRKNNNTLKIDEIKNKDPLVILKYVIASHTDKEIVTALRSQNKHLLNGLEEDRMEVTHRRKMKNPLVAHVVLRVSPQIWRSFTDAGAVFVDVQRIRVEDQSPLVQCSKCLGYGHGRRFCSAPLEACSHCGGPHIKTECADWLAAEPATCCNCQRAKLADVGHNAFSGDCPVRKKWDSLARSCIAYC